jgi:hypothetical protein
VHGEGTDALSLAVLSEYSDCNDPVFTVDVDEGRSDSAGCRGAGKHVDVSPIPSPMNTVEIGTGHSDLVKVVEGEHEGAPRSFSNLLRICEAPVINGCGRSKTSGRGIHQDTPGEKVPDIGGGTSSVCKDRADRNGSGKHLGASPTSS